MTFKRYGYPIIELGGQVVGALHKFYQENQCIENSITKYNAFEICIAKYNAFVNSVVKTNATKIL